MLRVWGGPVIALLAIMGAITVLPEAPELAMGLLAGAIILTGVVTVQIIKDIKDRGEW